MDEKGLTKLKQLLEKMQELKDNGKHMRFQGFTDRLGVAREIYQRNKEDQEFINELNNIVDSKKEKVFEQIISE